MRVSTQRAPYVVLRDDALVHFQKLSRVGLVQIVLLQGGDLEAVLDLVNYRATVSCEGNGQQIFGYGISKFLKRSIFTDFEPSAVLRCLES
jgi:hypothetical protein